MATQVTTTTGAPAAAAQTQGLDNLRPDAKKKVEAVIRNMKKDYEEQLTAASSKIDDLSKKLREKRNEKRTLEEKVKFVEAQLAAANAENASIKGLQADTTTTTSDQAKGTNPEGVEGHTVITMQATLDRAEPLKRRWALLQRDFVELNNQVTPIYNDSPGRVSNGKRSNEQLLSALGVMHEKQSKEVTYIFTEEGVIEKFNALKDRYLALVFEFNKVIEDLSTIEQNAQRTEVPLYHQETFSRVEIKPMGDFTQKFADHETHFQKSCAMLRELTTMRESTHAVVVECRKHINFIWQHTTPAPRDPQRIVDLAPTVMAEEPKEKESEGGAASAAS